MARVIGKTLSPYRILEKGRPGQFRRGVQSRRYPPKAECYGPVDQRTREVLMFLHEDRVHFNLTFIYRHRSWDQWVNFTDRFAEA